MTEPPFAIFSIPERFEIDGPFVARQVEELDVPVIAPAFRDPGIGGENGMPPFDEAVLRAFLRERLPELRARAVLVPYVIEDTAGGSLHGGITFRHFDPMRGVIEIGYWLFARARGRGLATRSVRAAAREPFATGLWRVEANVRIGNEASERVLERAGFTREGVKRRLLRHGGGRVDATLFSLLADEWRGSNRSSAAVQRPAALASFCQGRDPRLGSSTVQRFEADPFTPQERERARRYHKPLYLAVLARLVLVVAVYGVLAGHAISGLGWAGDAAAWAALVVVAATLVCLPLDFWRGQLRERRWGFSTQTSGAWLADRAKSVAITVALVAAAWTALIALARWLPRWWPAPAAVGAALAVLILTLLAPLLLEPLFNHFRPLPDQDLARALRKLADDAGVPLRAVLVADASRRTVKSNAYVSGLGPTRRLVVWDTLLRTADDAELKLVVAHELGHRRERHILKGTLLAMTGAVAAVLLLWVTIGTPKPGDYPVAALLLTALELAALPVGAALSRRWERTADRWSLDLTGDPDAFLRTHVSLARSNLADLDPPRVAYLALFSHPTPPERLALARKWVRTLPVSSSALV